MAKALQFRVQKKFIINDELIMELAKLGASVKVLEPASL
jgi:predicted DNA-binding transcriptional regulator YafY